MKLTLNQLNNITNLIKGQKILLKGFTYFFTYFYKFIYNREVKYLDQEAMIRLLDAWNKFDKNKEYRFLVLNAFPRIGKTTIASFFIAYNLAINKQTKFIYTSYSNELLTNCANMLKMILQNEEYIKLYGSTLKEVINEIEIKTPIGIKSIQEKEANNKIKNVFNSKMFLLKEGGQVRFASLGSAITGFGADIIIIDDPSNPADRFSVKKKENVRQFYINVLSSRLDNNKTGKILCMMQRVSVDDLSAYLISKPEYQYNKIEIPLIDKNNKCLMPDKFGEKEIERIKVDRFNFQAQYQQKPINANTIIIDTKLFKTYIEDISNLQIEDIYITTDYAFTDTKNSDSTCLCVWGKKRDNNGFCKVYLLDIVWGKYLIHDKLNITKQLVDKWKYVKTKHQYCYCSCLFIESVRNEDFIILLREKQIPIRVIKRNDGKLQRANSFVNSLGLIADIYFPANHHLLKQIYEQCESFTGDNSVHDDVCFIGTTKIKTIKGDIEIQNIKAGDKVITPFGIREVECCKITGEKEVIYNKELDLTGTPDHKILCNGYGYCDLKDTYIDNCLFSYDKDEEYSLLNVFGIDNREKLVSYLKYKDIKTNKKPTIEQKGKQPVWNLKVKGGCYFANNILVSNCDTIFDSILLGCKY